MYSYITSELYSLITSSFPLLDPTRFGISGHSMGGHGALTIYLKNSDKFKSCSAFAPIVNPSAVPWGQKAFTGYLATKEEWANYDATELVKKLSSEEAGKLELLVDQGDKDNFYPGQLQPEVFAEAVKGKGGKVELRMQVRYRALQGGLQEFQVNNELNSIPLNNRSFVFLAKQPGYDHSYWFISTFIDDHLDFAHKKLSAL